MRPLTTPIITNQHFMSTARTNRFPQPITVPKSNIDPLSNLFHDHDYNPKESLKILGFYPHAHYYSSPIEVENVAKKDEREEMASIMKSLEQSVIDMEGLGGDKCILFSYCACFLMLIYLSILEIQNLRNLIVVEIP